MNRAVVVAMVLLAYLTFTSATHAQAQPPWDDDQRIATELGVTSWSLQSLPHFGDGRDGDLHVRIMLGDAEYDLVLAPHTVRSPGFRVMLDDGLGNLVEAPLPPPQTYRGHIQQALQATVAATIRDGQLGAMILLEGQMAQGEHAWYIQPLNVDFPDAPADIHIIYRASDAPADEHGCGGALPTFVQPPLPQPGGGTRGGGGDSPLICNIAIDADHAYYQQNSASVSATTSDVESIINSVSLIYEADAEIEFHITDIIIRTANTPYISGVTSGNLLNQFRNHWNAHHTNIQRDIAHLFTGIMTTDSNVVGLAWLAVVCNQSQAYAYSRSRYTSNMSRRIGLHAHEIGHNFSADHCNITSHACSPCAIMCSSIGGCGGNTSTLGCSATRIGNYAQGQSCLSSGCTAPAITSHPAPRSVDSGDKVAFSIGASGTAPRSYQWRRNGDNLSNGGAISGATSATLTIDPASSSDAGTYTCVITNACGSIISQGALLTVNTCSPPELTSHPAPRSISIGDPVSFSVEANGSAPLSYQWRKNGADVTNASAISGATTSTLTINPASASHAGEYLCIVTNSCGAVASNSAMLTVTGCDPPAITSHPAGQTVAEGLAAAMSITATGEGVLQYRWRRDGLPLSNGGAISGATTHALIIEPVAPSHSGQYDCIVTSDCGKTTSSAATLTVVVPPAISTHPSPTDTCTGQRAVLTVAATGSTPLHYQWRRNGQNIAPAPHISGVNAPTLTIDPASPADAGAYTVVVSNLAGSATSHLAALTVQPGATITQQPLSTTVPAGRRATFTIAATGEGLTYRWLRNGVDLADGPTIFGSGTPTLTITPVQPGNAGEYSVRIDTACGSTASSSASLNITQPTPSTLAWWRFEEGRNGNGNPGPFRSNDRAISQVNSPALDLVLAEGRPRYDSDTPGPQIDGAGSNNLSMRFHGEDALQLLSEDLLDFGLVSSASGEFTIELFIKIEPAPSTSAAYRLLQKLEPDDVNRGYELLLWTGASSGAASLGTLSAEAGDGGQASLQTTIQRIDDGLWHHIAWRRYFDGSTARFEVWVDYELEDAVKGAAAGNLGNDAELWIGCGSDVGSSDYFVGWMDEIRISDRPLLPSEFLRVTGASTCYANCDESTGEPLLTIDDLICFVERFTHAQSLPHEQQISHYANCDGSTSHPVLNINDFICFIERFEAGCP